MLSRCRVCEFGFWALLVGCALVFPYRLPLLTQMLITGLFAVSLDVALGYAGILTLGHAAFFGLGAYTVGLLATQGWGEPLSGLLAAFMVGGLAGALCSPLLIRGSDLTRLLITVAVCLLLTEAARQFSGFTGGTDGLAGLEIWPVLGLFAFDFFGQTAFYYTFGVVLFAFLLLRYLLQSPFGLSLAGIQQNPHRMSALGAPVGQRLTVAYVISAAWAALAGGLLAQTTQFVGVETISFERSAEVRVRLILGGTRHMYGGVIGAIIYLLRSAERRGGEERWCA